MASIAMTPTTMSSRSSSKGLEEQTSLEPNNNPMQAWWETIAKARSAIQSLNAIIGPLSSLQSLLDSDRPAKSLLDNPEIAASISAHLYNATSGSASDVLCQWLYDTHQSSDPELQLVVLRYVPLVAGLYLSRIVAQKCYDPPAGFEAVILALYTSEVKARGGRPLVVNIPDLGQPSLYHAPRNPSPESNGVHTVGQLCAPLEPHLAIKSTKRAAVVGVALDLFHRKIALMPASAKVEFCEFVQGWAGQNCSCARSEPSDSMPTSVSMCNEEEIQCESPGESIRAGLDTEGNGSADKADIFVGSSSSSVSVSGEFNSKGVRIPLPWELLQPILRILGHCLLGPLNPPEVMDAASVATRVLFARVSHELVPEAILATRSLIRLDVAARVSNEIARSAANGVVASSSTPTRSKKPEVLLVSK